MKMTGCLQLAKIWGIFDSSPNDSPVFTQNKFMKRKYLYLNIIDLSHVYTTYVLCLFIMNLSLNFNLSRGFQ